MALYKQIKLPINVKKNITEYFVNKSLINDIKCFISKKNKISSFYNENYLNYLIRNCIVKSEYNIYYIIKRAFLWDNILKKFYSETFISLPEGYYYLDKLVERNFPVFKIIFGLMNNKERDSLIKIAEEHLNSKYKIGFEGYCNFMK